MDSPPPGRFAAREKAPDALAGRILQILPSHVFVTSIRIWSNTRVMLLPPKLRWEEPGCFQGGLAALRDDDEFPTGPAVGDLLPAVEAVGEEVARLRKTLLRFGHAQELFQQRVEEEVGRLARSEDRAPSSVAAQPNGAQQRALMEVDQAVLHLLALAQATGGEALVDPEAAPRSMREGLGLLQIRVRNLQRSFGLEPIPAVGRAFDDRCHQAYGICHLPGLADGEVAEEVLPGYRLGGKVVRPSLVIVNRRAPDELQ